MLNSQINFYLYIYFLFNLSPPLVTALSSPFAPLILHLCDSILLLHSDQKKKKKGGGGSNSVLAYLQCLQPVSAAERLQKYVSSLQQLLVSGWWCHPSFPKTPHGQHPHFIQKSIIISLISNGIIPYADLLVWRFLLLLLLFFLPRFQWVLSRFKIKMDEACAPLC